MARRGRLGGKGVKPMKKPRVAKPGGPWPYVPPDLGDDDGTGTPSPEVTRRVAGRWEQRELTLNGPDGKRTLAYGRQKLGGKIQFVHYRKPTLQPDELWLVIELCAGQCNALLGVTADGVPFNPDYLALYLDYWWYPGTPAGQIDPNLASVLPGWNEEFAGTSYVVCRLKKFATVWDGKIGNLQFEMETKICLLPEGGSAYSTNAWDQYYDYVRSPEGKGLPASRVNAQSFVDAKAADIAAGRSMDSHLLLMDRTSPDDVISTMRLLTSSYWFFDRNRFLVVPDRPGVAIATYDDRYIDSEVETEATRTIDPTERPNRVVGWYTDVSNGWERTQLPAVETAGVTAGTDEPIEVEYEFPWIHDAAVLRSRLVYILNSHQFDLQVKERWLAATEDRQLGDIVTREIGSRGLLYTGRLLRRRMNPGTNTSDVMLIEHHNDKFNYDPVSVPPKTPSILPDSQEAPPDATNITFDPPSPSYLSSQDHTVLSFTQPDTPLYKNLEIYIEYSTDNVNWGTKTLFVPLVVTSPFTLPSFPNGAGYYRLTIVTVNTLDVRSAGAVVTYQVTPATFFDAFVISGFMETETGASIAGQPAGLSCATISILDKARFFGWSAGGYQQAAVTSNAVWDGTQWLRDDVAKRSWRMQFVADGDYFAFYRAAAAANPIVNWTELLRIDSVGIGIGGAAAAGFGLHLTRAGNAFVQAQSTVANSAGFFSANTLGTWFAGVSSVTGSYVIQDIAAGANRIVFDTAGDVAIGTAPAAGNRLLVRGFGSTAGANTFVLQTSTINSFIARDDGVFGIGGTSPLAAVRMLVRGLGTTNATDVFRAQNTASVTLLNVADDGTILTGPGNVGLGGAPNGLGGTVTTARLDVVKDAVLSDYTVAQLIIRGATNPLRTLGVGYDTTNNHGFIQAAEQGTAYRDLHLNPAGGNVYSRHTHPLTHFTYDLGLDVTRWRALHAAELRVQTLIAQNTIATIGGRILVGPTTKLTADIGAAATGITVEHNQLTVGDRIYLESAPGGVQQIEFMAVTAGPFGTGPYSYTVTRNLDATGANSWKAGDAVFNTGQAGSGFIDIYSVRGTKASAELGPTIVGNVRNSATFNDWSPRWAIGNLNGLYGYATNTYGVAMGVPTGAWVKIDPTNGVRIGHNTTVKIQLDASGNASFTGSITAASGVVGGFTIGATELFAGSGVTRVQMSSTSGIWLGADAFASAPFSVSPAGALKATSGVIGGWTLGATLLSAGNAFLESTGNFTLGTGSDVARLSASDTTYRIWVGNATAGSAPFRVSKTGELTARDGEIGGWNIGTTSLSGGGVTLNASGSITAGNVTIQSNEVMFGTISMSFGSFFSENQISVDGYFYADRVYAATGINGGFRVGSNRVVGDREPAISLADGTLASATSRINALIVALQAGTGHGLLADNGEV